MKLIEAIEVLNSKQMNIQALAKELGSSKDLLSDILKDHGYVFNNSTKLREYVGEGEPVNVDLDLVIKERKSGKGSKSKKQVSKNNKVKVEEKSDLDLTKDEIIFIKNLARNRLEWETDFELNYHFSKLPPRKPTKKVPYEISLQTFKEFEAFAEEVGEQRRMTRNDLVEMALRKFMSELN